MMAKKRGGQVSIFFILAIFIIIIGAVILHYKSLSIEEEYVEPEFVPVTSYIEECIESVAERGAMLLGATGGYIEIPPRIANDPRAFLAMGPEGTLKSPYWWHDGITAAPTEKFIKKQLEDYISGNLRKCLRNFEAFKGEYDIREKGELRVAVTLADNSILVEAKYPLEVTYNLGKTKLELKGFKQSIPIRLKKALELAKAIMERENTDFFLEKKTIDLMAMSKEVPFTGVEVTCTQKQWNLGKIKKRVKYLLAVNLPFVRVKNADYEQNVYVPTPDGKNTYESSYYQSHYIWDVSDSRYSGLSVSLTYDEKWPFELEARPRRGELLSSNPMNGRDLLDWFCIQLWHFTYDVAYPVRVAIIDRPAKDHKGYSFNFAFKVSIDHNQPRRESFAHEMFEAAEEATPEEYCNDLYDEVTIYTVANATEMYDLEGVELTLTCGPFTCPLGKSEYLSFGAAAGIRKRLPYCVHGILRGSKDGFEKAEMFIQTDAGKAYTLYLTPAREFTYRVVKHPLVDPADELRLKEEEKASISIRAKDTDFESFGIYPSEGSFPIKLLGDKEHAYEVTIYLLDGDDVIGGYKAEWTVSPDDVQGANEIVFHVLDQGLASDEERFLFLSALESYSRQVPKPELR
jgi:hypothetical protein